MPEFILDTSGGVNLPRSPRSIIRNHLWHDINAFTQGYIEALFFTDCSDADEDGGLAAFEHDYGRLPGFADLAPPALARIIDECAAFQASPAWKAVKINLVWAPLAQMIEPENHAGRDFWYTRCGHGVGFWDGDWPEPYATQLTKAAEAFGNVDPYLGDDGKVYLS